MKKTGLFLITLLLSISFWGISAPFAQAATEKCSNCHHVDFQTAIIDRATVCVSCHTDVHVTLTEAQLNTTAATLHTLHKGTANQPLTPASGCSACHIVFPSTYYLQVNCVSCHTTVTHGTHPQDLNSEKTPVAGVSGYYTNGINYMQVTLTCINSNCHNTYWSSTGVVITKPDGEPLCLNCHDNIHGSQMGAGDDYSVLMNPNVNPALSDISIKWFFQSGDSLQKSLDGINWTNINIGTPSAGNFYTYTDIAIPNWSIVNYKLLRSGGVERSFPVYPPGVNAHTNYMDNTQMCAACHVTHAATQTKLLKEETIEDLCRTCHGLTNAGSRYNVDTGETVIAGTRDANGLITATGYIRSQAGAFGLLSGGNYYAGNHAETWNGAEVTSTHSTNSQLNYIAPGGGNNEINLTCTSCHLSHPKKNAYRLLYTSSNPDRLNEVSVEAFAVNPTGAAERTNYIRNMNVSCGCHQQYITTTGSGHTMSNNSFKHAVGVAIQGPYASNNPTTGAPWSLTTTLPTEYYDKQGRAVGTLVGAAPTQAVDNGAVVCITCHYPHGTIAQGLSESNYDLNADSDFTNDYSTMLKRNDNNGDCQNCHKR